MAHKGKKLTPEHRAALAAAQHKRWANPETRAAFSRQNKERWNDPEARARMVAKMKETLIANGRDPESNKVPPLVPRTVEPIDVPAKPAKVRRAKPLLNVLSCPFCGYSFIATKREMYTHVMECLTTTNLDA